MWIKEGTGYTDTDQRVPWSKIIESHCKFFCWSCLLYYKLDTPVLTDVDFDHTQELLEKYYEITPDWFRGYFTKGNLKTEAHAFLGADNILQEAISWRERMRPSEDASKSQ